MARTEIREREFRTGLTHGIRYKTFKGEPNEIGEDWYAECLNLEGVKTGPCASEQAVIFSLQMRAQRELEKRGRK